MVEAVEEQTPGWGLGDAALGVLSGWVCLLIAAGIASGGSKSNETSLTALAVGEVGLWVGLVGVMVWASRTKGSGRLGQDFGLQMRRADVGLGVPVGVVSQLVLVPVLYLPIQWLIGRHDLSAPAKDIIGKAHGDGGLVLLAVVLIAGAPVVEELFFRGLVLRSLQRRFARTAHGDGWAIGVSAVIFGFAHLEPLQFPALALFGAILGYLAVRTGRLGPGIWAHAAFNALAVAFLAK
jgi:CAAX protease family protein